MEELMPENKPKRKKINYHLLSRSDEPELYELMDELVRQHHEDLCDANIAIAWRFGWKADPDGRLTLGQMKRASDLDRQLHGHDFVILLNYEAWSAAEFTKAQKLALLDHELCHGRIAYDEDLEPKRDEADNLVYRTRKHDLEEFVEVVERHGLWRHDLQRFAEAALEAADAPLLAEQLAEARAKRAARDPKVRRAAEQLRPEAR
jgi:hypothetical protein